MFTDNEEDGWGSDPDPVDSDTAEQLYTPPTPPPIELTVDTTSSAIPPITEETDLILTPTEPPQPPVDQELPCRPSDPTDPPTSTSSGTDPFVKLKNRFFKLFK
jgi:hypothetical protein